MAMMPGLGADNVLVGYDRKRPLGFTVGSGRVIKGFVFSGFFIGRENQLT